jgi:farnesyl-diphosphate farnesyltransferase
MSRDSFVPVDSNVSDEEYQNRILPHVSRTFALTIPQLPAALRTSVTNAYLLCRIADTIEDETSPSAAATLVLLQRFVAIVCGGEPASLLVQDLASQLSTQTLPAERDLILNMERIVAVTRRLEDKQRAAIRRCVEIMCDGMHQFQQTASVRGLARASDLDDYCYYVAGVVGQMLTELFCAYSTEIRERRTALDDLAVSFAQGLQMTNILKDVWEDRARGACWLPQEVFTPYGVELGQLSAEHSDGRFGCGMLELVGVAHDHLRNALAYTLVIPGHEAGIRRFCLWAIGLAILTLRRIARNPDFTRGGEVKVSHSAVALTQLLTNLSVRNDWMLRRLFALAAAGVPLAAPTGVRPARSLQPSGSVTHIGQAVRHAPLEHATRRSEGRSAH